MDNYKLLWYYNYFGEKLIMLAKNGFKALMPYENNIKVKEVQMNSDKIIMLTISRTWNLGCLALYKLICFKGNISLGKLFLLELLK